jgi:predicted secreted protein
MAPKDSLQIVCFGLFIPAITANIFSLIASAIVLGVQTTGTMQLPPYALHIGAILILVVFAAGYTGGYLSRDRPLAQPVGGENAQPFHQLRPSEGTTIVLDEADDGQMYALPRNTGFTVILPETPALGHSWNTTISPGLNLLNSQYVADPYAPRFDVNGTHIWMLNAKNSGLQEFRAWFVLGGSPGNPVVETYSVKLLVNPDT